LVGASPGAGLSVAVTVAAGDVAAPGGGGMAGAPGGKLAVGSCAGAAGFARAPGLTAGAGAPGGGPGGGPGGDVRGGAGDCASEVNASASEHRQAVSNVFIIEARFGDRLGSGTSFPLSQTVHLRVEQNFSLFLHRHFASTKVASLIRIILAGGM
jgi:hypothetical protein